MNCELSSYLFVVDSRWVEDVEPHVHTEVLVAGSRLDQGRVRAAVDAIFDAYPALGAVFEPFFERWTTRLGGGWGWAVEPPGDTVADVIARQRAGFDLRTGRLFAVSLLPGAPDQLVVTASQLCMDEQAWRLVVDNLVAACGGELVSARTTVRA
jgi:hypothetical protein